MARYTDANCKLCRREGQKLFLKGERKEKLRSRTAWSGKKESVRLWSSVKRKAESKEILRNAGNSVQKLI